MKKISKEQLTEVQSFIESMISITSDKLNNKLQMLSEIASNNLYYVEKNKLYDLNGLGIVQSDNHEIDVLSAKLNTYVLARKFLLEDANGFKEQISCMINLIAQDLEKSLGTLKSTCLESSKSIENGNLENINGLGTLQNKGLIVDVLTAKLNAYHIILKHIEEI